MYKGQRQKPLLPLSPHASLHKKLSCSYDECNHIGLGVLSKTIVT